MAFTSALSAYAQSFLDFPAGVDNIPAEALKGPVHTVLTTEQRDNYIFTLDVVVYDKKGRVTESLSGDEFHRGKATYVYNGSGRLSRVNNFEPEGEFSAYSDYKYDDKGRLIEIKEFDAKGNSTGWDRYSYSTNKKEVEVTWQYPSGGMRSVLAYDEKARWISRTTFLGVDDLVKFEYDKDGTFVKEVHNGYGHTFTYKYDSHGNWIERVRAYYVLDNHGLDRSEDMHYYRIITYYSDAK